MAAAHLDASGRGWQLENLRVKSAQDRQKKRRAGNVLGNIKLFYVQEKNYVAMQLGWFTLSISAAVRWALNKSMLMEW